MSFSYTSQILWSYTRGHVHSQTISSCFCISTTSATLVSQVLLLHTFTWSGCLSANEANSEHHCDIMSNAGTGQSRQEALVNSSDDWKDGNRPRQFARTVNSSSSFWYKTRDFRLVPVLWIFIYIRLYTVYLKMFLFQ